MEVVAIKKTVSDHTIHPLIKKRWSPRSFSNEEIPEEALQHIFKAASWAASAMNEQPWRYIYAEKGTPGFEKLWNCLMPGNQPWTKDAPVIFVAIYNKFYESNGKLNRSALHDLGMANAQLLLQAASHDIYGHLMGGFQAEQVINALELEGHQVPFCMGVLGYLGDPEELDEPCCSRETAKRTRKNLREFVQKL